MQAQTAGRRKVMAIFFALIAAVFYALNAPLSKSLLEHVGPTMMAAFLYLGAGVGVGLLSLADRKRSSQLERLGRSDLPYVIGMVLLDIAAPIFLMFGLASSTAASTSLLNNFEIVATTVIALCLFHETITGRLWAGIALITLASILLSVEDFSEGLSFSKGSLLVLLATICWGFENNCTRKISGKSAFQIVFIKGLFSGLGSLVVALLIGERLPVLRYLLGAMLLGFVAYGLSIFFYIRAQSTLGAAKTSAYYAVAPFIGALLSFVFLHEQLSAHFALALLVMLAGSVVVVVDTLIVHHQHEHTHIVTHTHDGSTHEHTIVHTHEHTHLGTGAVHHHSHATLASLEHGHWTIDEVHRLEKK